MRRLVLSFCVLLFCYVINSKPQVNKGADQQSKITQLMSKHTVCKPAKGEPILHQLRLTPGIGRFSIVMANHSEEVELSNLAINEAFTISLGSMDNTLAMDREIYYGSGKTLQKGESITFIAPQTSIRFFIKTNKGVKNPVRAITVSVSGVDKRTLDPDVYYNPDATKEDLARGILAPAITTSTSPTVTDLIKNTLIGGDCFEVTNVTFSGDSQARGTFGNGGTSVGFNNGLIMCTGTIDVATGPNNQNSASGGNVASAGTDADLATLTTGSQKDVQLIEFDFKPT